MKKYEITDRGAIFDIIDRVKVCSLAMLDNGKPYTVPMNFGHKDGIIYFHSGTYGKKMDILKTNPEVCVSFYADEELNGRHKDVACSYSMKFRSVLMHGKVEHVNNIDEKIEMMNIIMKHYTGRDDFSYNQPAIDNVSIFYLDPEKITAFKKGY